MAPALFQCLLPAMAAVSFLGRPIVVFSKGMWTGGFWKNKKTESRLNRLPKLKVQHPYIDFLHECIMWDGRGHLGPGTMVMMMPVIVSEHGLGLVENKDDALWFIYWYHADCYWSAKTQERQISVFFCCWLCCFRVFLGFSGYGSQRCWILGCFRQINLKLGPDGQTPLHALFLVLLRPCS